MHIFINHASHLYTIRLRIEHVITRWRFYISGTSTGTSTGSDTGALYTIRIRIERNIRHNKMAILH